MLKRDSSLLETETKRQSWYWLISQTTGMASWLTEYVMDSWLFIMPLIILCVNYHTIHIHNYNFSTPIAHHLQIRLLRTEIGIQSPPTSLPLMLKLHHLPSHCRCSFHLQHQPTQTLHPTSFSNQPLHVSPSTDVIVISFNIPHKSPTIPPFEGALTH